MTLTARLEAATALMASIGSLNVPVPIDDVRQILAQLKEKEAKQ
jgi:hypothetical protein